MSWLRDLHRWFGRSERGRTLSHVLVAVLIMAAASLLPWTDPGHGLFGVVCQYGLREVEDVMLGQNASLGLRQAGYPIAVALVWWSLWVFGVPLA